MLLRPTHLMESIAEMKEVCPLMSHLGGGLYLSRTNVVILWQCHRDAYVTPHKHQPGVQVQHTQVEMLQLQLQYLIFRWMLYKTTNTPIPMMRASRIYEKSGLLAATLYVTRKV